MTYIGWVPTVTGHLSFTSIGVGSYPARSLRTVDDSRFVVAQRRDLLDVLLPYAENSEVVRFFREKLANLVIGVSGRFIFILDGTVSSNGDSCSGAIYIVPEADNKEFRKTLRHWFKSGGGAGDWPVDLAQKHACYVASYVLERAGKITIAPNTKFPTEQTSELPLLLANQAFYFVKDVAHVHQHHDPSHDAITEVSPASSKSDMKWVVSTQFSLYRAIIRYKRFRNEKALFRASGILAYARSFEKSYGTAATAKTYHVEELERSLAVAREEIKHFDQKRLSQIETFRNFFFATFGLVASVTFLSRLGEAPAIEVDSSVIWAANFLATKPFTVVGLTVLSSYLWAVLTHRIDPAENPLVRFITRLLQGFRVRYFFLFNLFAVGVLITLSYLLLR